MGDCIFNSVHAQTKRHEAINSNSKLKCLFDEIMQLFDLCSLPGDTSSHYTVVSQRRDGLAQILGIALLLLATATCGRLLRILLLLLNYYC